jgi:hypothetical protein
MAKIIIETALNEMARTSGATVAQILSVMLADPNGATARRFREYLALATA